MRYWDSSALVALCLDEPATPHLRKLTADGIVTWAVSRVEVASAIERRSREQTGDPTFRARGFAALEDVAGAWTQIESLAPVSERALRLLAVHTLRAADALQLGAALEAFSNRPRGWEFVCIDSRLRDAASREGFDVLPH